MKLLLDQNLSHRLAGRLDDLFPQSTHVRLVQLDRASDDKLWEYAKSNGYCIVTQDADFAERSRLYGSPPNVVWLRCGNCTPLQVERMLRQNAPVIIEMINNPALRYLELF